MRLSSQSEISDLHRVRRRSRRGSNESRVSAEGGVVRGRCRNEDVFGLNVTVEEAMRVDVVEAGEDLVENALDDPSIQVFVVSRLHQLVQVAIHVLHGDVEFLRQRVEEDIESRHEVSMIGQCTQEDHFAKLHARSEGLKCLLHRLDCDLLGWY